jgi:DNA-binding transcriptional MerR regulator
LTAQSAATRENPRGESLMSIGEVLGRLRPEFPDVTISKLRFLEAEGLVEPLRAPSGYRKYTAAHLDRLRFVLAAQRDRYLPLRVIREQIAATDRGERVVGLPAVPPPPFTTPPPFATTVTSIAPVQPSSRDDVAYLTADDLTAMPTSATATVPARRGELGEARLTRTELSQRSGLDEAGLVDLEQYGLLVPGPGGYYGGEALLVARIAAQLAEYGLEGRHLRPYRATADREVGLLAQLVTPLARQASLGGREQALETVHELAVLCAQLHGALVRQGLRQVLGA